MLKETQQWVVPVYQRHYEWETSEDRQLPKLWESLVEKADDVLQKRSNFAHYLGSIIYSEPANQPFGVTRRRILVDGQQRITTFQTVLVALREIAREREDLPKIDTLNAYLFNARTPSMQDPEREQFRLWPSRYDRDLYKHIVTTTRSSLKESEPRHFYKNGNLKTSTAPKLLRAYWFLCTKIDEYITEQERNGVVASDALNAVIAGFLTGFRLVVIQLDDNDDAQEIFSSLNGLSQPLTPFDLIRNDIFHRASRLQEDGERLFDNQWSTFESEFWTTYVRQGRASRARADHLVSHMVVAEAAREINAGKLAAEYHRYALERHFNSVGEEVAVLLGHAATYREMEQSSVGSNLAKISTLLRLWDLSTFHPLIFFINAAIKDDDEKLQIYKLIESFIVRRELCGLSTKNFNKVVLGAIRSLQTDGASAASLSLYFQHLEGESSKMPSDLEVAEGILRVNAYSQIPGPRLRFILQEIEYAMRTRFDEASISTSALTTEHVMPQKWTKYWPLPNGQYAPFVSSIDALLQGVQLDDETKVLIDARGNLINTLGNLTLLTPSLNPSLGHDAWKDKRGRIAESLLAMNRDIAKQENWSEDVIQKRGRTLSEIVNRRWVASA